MATENNLNRFTMIGVVAIIVFIGAMLLLNGLAGSPDATSAGPVPRVRD